MSEWLKEHAWKACKVARPSQVRILFSPPSSRNNPKGCFLFCLAFLYNLNRQERRDGKDSK